MLLSNFQKYAAFLLVTSSGLPSTTARGDNVDVVAIISSIQEALGPTNVKGIYQFTNHRTDGTTNEYEVTMLIRNANMSHVSFEKPAREKGRSLLRLNDEIWSYAPSVGKIIRIADRDSFAGGDFSNADILRIDWLAKYEPKLLKDLPKQWIIEMNAKTPDAPYAQMRIWVDKSSKLPVQQNHYDSKGTLLKQALYGSVKTLGGITRPVKVQMQNVITKQKSEMVVLALEKLNTIPDSRFVVDNLGK